MYSEGFGCVGGGLDLGTTIGRMIMANESGIAPASNRRPPILRRCLGRYLSLTRAGVITHAKGPKIIQ